MNRYNNGKIYKLVNSVDDQIYIGSTCNSLAKRKSRHKTSSRKRPTQRVYQHLNQIGWENVRIILIEKVQAQNKDQLRLREQHYIDLIRPSLNKNSAIDTCHHCKIQALCKDCGGASICQHNRQRIQCKDCGGASICQHNHKRSHCKECNPNHICFECNKNFNSKQSLTRHCRSAKHKKTCKDLFKEIFDYELLDLEIPIY